MFQKLDDDERTTSTVPVSPRAQWRGSMVQRTGAQARHKFANTLRRDSPRHTKRGESDEVDLGCGVGAVLELASAFAQEACESKAVSKYGRPLVGAAKASFIKKMQEGLLSKQSSGQKR
jgi:hypothetical protein